MAMFTILLLLGAFCLLIGSIVLIVAGFQESIWWGLAILFLPFAGLIFLFMHWERGKNGFLMMVAGIIFYAAAFVTMPPNAKPMIEALVAAKTGQPLPASLSGLLGGKPAVPDAKTPAAGTAAPAASTSAPAGAPAAAVSSAPATLETEAQVLAAVAELNDRAKALRARKEALRNSVDQPALFALTEDIKVFNERLKVVTTRQAELNQARTGVVPASSSPPATSTVAAPPANPVIPSTVVIPAPTPGPSPVPKKK